LARGPTGASSEGEGTAALARPTSTACPRGGGAPAALRRGPSGVVDLDDAFGFVFGEWTP